MSDAWPFSRKDWSRVGDAARAVLNATLAEDPVLRASHYEGLRLLLRELRDRYGDHPVLFETEADFADDPVERRELYEKALGLTLRGGWVTYSIRIALAGLLLEDFGGPGRARQELTACQSELVEHADEWDRQQWAELLARCGQGTGGR